MIYSDLVVSNLQVFFLVLDAYMTHCILYIFFNLVIALN